MDNHKIISVTETIKTIYMLKNWTITLVKDLQMILDSEAELAGDQLETASHNKEIRFHRKKEAAEFLIIMDNHKIISVMETIKTIFMLKSWTITLVKDSQMILDSEAELAGDQLEKASNFDDPVVEDIGFRSKTPWGHTGYAQK